MEFLFEFVLELIGEIFETVLRKFVGRKNKKIGSFEKAAVKIDNKFFMKSDKRDLKLVKKSLVKVVDCVSKNTAVTTYNIINKEYVVFIGTVDNPELFLHMYVIKIKGDKALCAVLNNEVRWCEFDYKDRDEFEMIVASNVIKSIEETKKLVRENKMI